MWLSSQNSLKKLTVWPNQNIKTAKYRPAVLAAVALNRHSSQVFHFWPKCWEKPKMRSHPGWTSAFCRFQDMAVQSFLIILFQRCHFTCIVTEVYLRETRHEFTEKAANLQFWPFLCFDNNTAENTFWKLRTWSNFLQFCFYLATLNKIS